jgi:hypothetical protein
MVKGLHGKKCVSGSSKECLVLLEAETLSSLGLILGGQHQVSISLA